MITYLCGGIEGLSDHEKHGWREQAKSLLKTHTLDPTRRVYDDPYLNDCYITLVEEDLADIYKSDFVLVKATSPSWGTAMEIAYASRIGCEVVAFTDKDHESHPWLKYHCIIYKTLEEAVQHINSRVKTFHLL